MIKLEHISINELMKDLFWQMHNQNNAATEAYKIIKKYNVKDFGKLKEILEEHGINNDYLSTALSRITKKLAQLNSKNNDLQIFNFENYEDEYPRKTDREITGEQLLISNPLVPSCNILETRLESLDIASIKHLLSHIDSRGNNAITNIRGIGKNSAQAIYKAVEFYDAQIARQSKGIDNKEINLFWLNADEKADALILGNEPIEESMEYIAKNAEEMIWGYLTLAQKQKILEMIKKDNRYGNIIFNKLYNAIANYVTLEEAEKGLIKTRAIDRFIVK